MMLLEMLKTHMCNVKAKMIIVKCFISRPIHPNATVLKSISYKHLHIKNQSHLDILMSLHIPVFLCHH